VLVIDTSGLVAFFDSSDAHHHRASAVVGADDGPFLVSPYVVAELDDLVATRRGVHQELAVLSELSSGAWELPAFGPADLAEARDVIDRYRDLEIGAADASLVVLARRYRTNRLLTLDRRHFSVVRTADGRAFDLLPELSGT
jgi:predicted nucleic acid-binding protein